MMRGGTFNASNVFMVLWLVGGFVYASHASGHLLEMFMFPLCIGYIMPIWIDMQFHIWCILVSMIYACGCAMEISMMMVHGDCIYDGYFSYFFCYNCSCLCFENALWRDDVVVITSLYATIRFYIFFRRS